MELHGDPTVFPAAIVATVIALAVVGIGRAGILAEHRQGSTPLWVYAFGVVSFAGIFLVAVGAGASPFGYNLAMIVAGMGAGSMAVYFALRAMLSVWARLAGRPEDT